MSTTDQIGMLRSLLTRKAFDRLKPDPIKTITQFSLRKKLAFIKMNKQDLHTKDAQLSGIELGKKESSSTLQQNVDAEGAKSSNSNANSKALNESDTQSKPPKEIGGPKGLEPTRYGDWEAKGRCYDF